MALEKYRQKRYFAKTPEPKGRSTKGGKTLHFVVQRHAARRLHWDFRLELDGVLKSWAVPKGPSMNPEDKRLAVMTEDHPLEYAKFEGEIPQGNYGAGTVELWDEGVYASAETADPVESRKKIKSGLYKGEIKFALMGDRLTGRFALIKLKNSKEKDAWLLIKEKDEFAKVDAGKKTSTERRKPDNMPHDVDPMLASLVREPFDRDNWLYEIKWDGYRAVAEVEKGDVRLYSRNHISFLKKYPSIATELKKIKHDAVLDGEIIALKDGRPDFHTLQNIDDSQAPLQYMMFDLLYLDGEDLRDRPLRERKEHLRKILPKKSSIALSEHIEKEGREFFEVLRKQHIEGMVAKDANSPYREGERGSEWLKVKSFHEQEAIIIGFTKPRRTRKYLGALVLGAYENESLRYIGHSGGGFNDKELKELSEKLARYKTSVPPVAEKVPVNSPITWVRPHFVCQVQFSEWTPDGRMRHPIYAGLRVDKKPEEVVKEMPGSAAKVSGSGGKVGKPISVSPKSAKEAFTNLDKVFWPKEGYTKGDVIAYYERMAKHILPYLKDRPENLNRHPNGIEGKNFYQKDITMKLPGYIETKKIYSESNEKELRYLLCQNEETLLYMANLGCIEINPWNSRIQNLDAPDYMIIDLDPNGRSFEDVITVALEVKKILDLACEAHYPKTSGKTGLHVLVPLGAKYPYEDITNFAKLITQMVNARLPNMTSIERSPKKRKGLIYLDYLQNRRGQTIAAPYSLRPYPGATVSTPLRWKEIKKGLNPGAFTIDTIEKRIAKYGDLMEPLLTTSIDLTESIEYLRRYVDTELA